MDFSTIPSGSSDLKDFYKGRSVFVTGATGFIGKVLIEKLLRTCDEIDKIYVLIRPKPKQDVRERLQQMLNTKIFEKLKKMRPNALAKVMAVSGDIALPNLGIGAEDERSLVDNVSIVFHVAAVLKFNEELGKSVNMNVRSTKRVLDLCHQMPKIAALVHMSTAYCNCDLQEVDEKVYVLPQSPQQVMEATEWMSEDCAKSIVPHLLGKRPNTYTYTKALAENILLTERGNIPVAIIRPSIVGPTWKEPMLGWIDSLNAIAVLFVGFGSGALHSAYCNPDISVDVIPVDACANMTIAAAWYTSTYKANDVSVFNCTSGSSNPQTCRETFDIFHQGILEYPFENVWWYPSFTFHRNKTLSDFCSLFVHILPAYVMDAIMWILGKKTFAVNMQTKLQKAVKPLEYFLNHEWRFSTNNCKMLMLAMSAEDRKLFNFDVQALDWTAYNKTGVLGCKLYLLKEDIKKLPETRKHLRRLYYLRQIAYAFVFIFVSKLLLNFFDIL